MATATHPPHAACSNSTTNDHQRRAAHRFLSAVYPAAAWRRALGTLSPSPRWRGCSRRSQLRRYAWPACVSLFMRAYAWAGVGRGERERDDEDAWMNGYRGRAVGGLQAQGYNLSPRHRHPRVQPTATIQTQGRRSWALLRATHDMRTPPSTVARPPTTTRQAAHHHCTAPLNHTTTKHNTTSHHTTHHSPEKQWKMARCTPHARTRSNTLASQWRECRITGRSNSTATAHSASSTCCCRASQSTRL